MDQEHQKANCGAKTKYRPEYDIQIIELMEQGLTTAECCARFKITPKTIYNWENEFPDFKEAYAIARTIGLSFYLEKMRNGIFTDKEVTFNFKACQFMINRQFGARFGDILGKNNYDEVAAAIVQKLDNDEISYESATDWLTLIEKSSKIYLETKLIPLVKEINTKMSEMENDD